MAFENVTQLSIQRIATVAQLKALTVGALPAEYQVLVAEAQALVYWQPNSLATSSDANGIIRPDSIGSDATPGRWIFLRNVGMVYPDELFDNGALAASDTIDFKAGPIQNAVLAANVTSLDFLFPYRGTFFLRLFQNAPGGYSIAGIEAEGSLAKVRAAEGQILLGSASGARTLWQITWDGDLAYIDSLPNTDQTNSTTAAP